MSHGSMPTIYALNHVSECHLCSGESIVICRICVHGFCREHFVMCTGCHEWLCAGCFDSPLKHKCRALAVVEIGKKK